MPPGLTNWTPQVKASTAGAMPKVMTSASESISRPKSLTVLVMRAMRPSRPSSTTATPMALAADFKMWHCCRVARLRRQQRAFDGADDGDESQKNIAGGEQSGQRVGGTARAARGRAGIEESLLES